MNRYPGEVVRTGLPVFVVGAGVFAACLAAARYDTTGHSWIALLVAIPFALIAVAGSIASVREAALAWKEGGTSDRVALGVVLGWLACVVAFAVAWRNGVGYELGRFALEAGGLAVYGLGAIALFEHVAGGLASARRFVAPSRPLSREASAFAARLDQGSAFPRLGHEIVTGRRDGRDVGIVIDSARRLIVQVRSAVEPPRLFLEAAPSGVAPLEALFRDHGCVRVRTVGRLYEAELPLRATGSAVDAQLIDEALRALDALIAFADTPAGPVPIVSASTGPLLCPYCRDIINAARGAEPSEPCTKCGTVHHRTCLAEARGCTVFGCAGAAPVRVRA